MSELKISNKLVVELRACLLLVHESNLAAMVRNCSPIACEGSAPRAVYDRVLTVLQKTQALAPKGTPPVREYVQPPPQTVPFNIRKAGRE